MIEFRDLRADEIEVRVQSVKSNGLILLLYKDARCDMRILDETVGAENWQREHYECKGNLFCRVGIDVNAVIEEDDPRWVWKADCGTESNTEKEKGESSDSFKRACTNWGIGRELYTSPFIWVKSVDCNINDTGRKDSYGKPIYECKDKFTVSRILIEDKKIKALSIHNETTKKRVFLMMPEEK